MENNTQTKTVYTTNDFLNALFDAGQKPAVTYDVGEKKGAFFTPNPTDGQSWKNKDVTHNQCFFIEWDHIDLDQQRKRIKDLIDSGLVPTAVSFSGNRSYHVFIRLENALDKEEWQHIQKWLLKELEADSSVKNRARLMRLGGYKNQEIMMINKRTKNKEFFKWLNKNGYKEETEDNKNNVIKLDTSKIPTDEKSKYANKRLETEKEKVEQAPKGDRNNTLNKSAYTMGAYVGDDAISAEKVFNKLRNAARKAGLSDFEISSTLSSGIDDGMRENDAWYPEYTVNKYNDVDWIEEMPEEYNLLRSWLKDNKVTASEVLDNEVLIHELELYFYKKGFSDVSLKKVKKTYLPVIKNRTVQKELSVIAEYKNIDPGNVGKLLSSKKPKIADLAIKHFIWQIKRKAVNKPVEFNIMPVLVGKQGCGKSVFIKKLLNYLPEHFIGNITLAEMAEPRSNKGKAEKLVLFCDEMSGARKAEIETLKNWITSDKITYRPMNTNNTSSVYNRSTSIGASNLDVKNIIKDKTGMRRFCQIDCDALKYSNDWSMDTLDWDAINNYDFNALWLSVDPHKNSPAKDIMSELTTSVVVEDSIDAWLDDFSIPDNKYIPGRGVGSSELHKLYKEWSYNNGYKHPESNKALSIELVKRGWIKKRYSKGVFFQLPDKYQD